MKKLTLFFVRHCYDSHNTRLHLDKLTVLKKANFSFHSNNSKNYDPLKVTKKSVKICVRMLMNTVPEVGKEDDWCHSLLGVALESLPLILPDVLIKQASGVGNLRGEGESLIFINSVK